MINRFLLSAVLFFLAAATASAEQAAGFKVGAGTPSLRVEAPSADTAFAYLELTLRDMDFFRANNYPVSLPEHPLFDGAGAPTPAGADRRAVFEREVYRIEAFAAALATLEQERGKLQTALARIAGWERHEGFSIPESFVVSLTLYGPGGSFDPDRGHITLWTDRSGRFKGGGGVHTIIHEMIHIVVEHGIAQPFELAHWDRERLVDLIAQREFRDLLPDYRLQGGESAPMDAFVANASLADLRSAVADYALTTKE